MGDSDVIGRLRRGQSITLRTADRIYSYMNAERTRRAEAGARRATACQEGAYLSEADLPARSRSFASAKAGAEDREAALERGRHPGGGRWARFLAWFRPASAEAKRRLRAGRP